MLYTEIERVMEAAGLDVSSQANATGATAISLTPAPAGSANAGPAGASNSTSKK